MVPLVKNCSKTWTYFRTLFQKTEWYLRLKPAQMPFGKNPGKSGQTHIQTQAFSILGHPTRKPPKGGNKGNAQNLDFPMT